MLANEFKPSFDKLQKSKEFKDWIAKSKECFMSYAMSLFETPKQSPWQIGYYNKKTEKITSFVVEDKIKIMPEEEVFKRPEDIIKEVEIKKLKQTLNNVLTKAVEFQKKKYPNDDPAKIIILLQNINSKDVWNLNIVTKVYNNLNIQIDCENGKIVFDKLTSLFDFAK